MANDIKEIAEKGVELVKKASAEISKLVAADKVKSAQLATLESQKQAAARLSGPIVDALIKQGYITASAREEALESFSNPELVAGQLQIVLEKSACVSMGLPSESPSLTGTNKEASGASDVDSKYLRTFGVA